MSLGSKMASLEGKGRFAIWKRTSSPQDVRVIRKDIMRYMSEHTKEGVDTVASHAQNHPNWLKEGIDYLTKEDQGKLKVYGFLRDDVIRRTGHFPHRMKNDDLVEACLEAWEARLKKKKIKRVAHKYVLSLNPVMCEVMAQTGHSADEVLTQSVRRTIRKYQEKYYPNEKMGYLVGIHHDKAHLHAHVMLFPTAKSGKLLRVTDESAERGGRKPFQDMRKFATQEVSRYYNREIKSPFRASERKPSKYAQPKLLAFLSYQRAKSEAKKRGFSPEEQRARAFKERERIVMGEPRKLQRDLHEAYQGADKLYQALRTSKRGKGNKKTPFHEMTKMRVQEERSQLNMELKGLFREMKELKADSQTTQRARRELYTDMSNWTHFRFNYGSVTEGGNNMRDHEVYDWVQKKMASSDTLGSLIKGWVDEKRSRNEAVNLPKEMLRLMASATNPVAAQKFTEKDKYARKCITHGTDKIKDPALAMMDHFYRQNAFLSNHSQKDFVREFLKSSVQVHKQELQAISERREEISKRIKELRLQQQSNKLKQDIVQCVDKGYTPSFLEEYQHWNNLNMEIPTEGIQIVKSGAKARQEAETSGALPGGNKVSGRADEDYSTRLHATLRQLRGQRMDTGSLTLVGNMSDYHRGGKDPTTRLHDTREQVLDSSLDRRASQFLQARRDGGNRATEENEMTAEDRRRHLRESRIEQDDVGLLER